MGQTLLPPSSTVPQTKHTPCYGPAYSHTSFLESLFQLLPYCPEAPEVFLTILNLSVPLPAACLSRDLKVRSSSSPGSSSSPLSQAQETPRAPKRPVPVLVVAEESHPCRPSPVHTYSHGSHAQLEPVPLGLGWVGWDRHGFSFLGTLS